ncbi:dihydrolipoamide acetyltransferase family protein [Pseudonocardia adelaidensis]|uniref:dihydrolipoamide acetyltransferase family protein n=1 Tax=Pseudonocardia adelaidensis TaxID=648754 RepID=UPI0031ECEAE1
MAEVRMPRLSESMAEGTIVRWLHGAGDEVDAGQEIAEIETDKAVVGLEAEAAGVLEIVVPEGGSAAVGAVIARLGGAPPGPPTRPIASPLARRRARELGVDLHGLAGTGPHGRIVRDDVEGAARSAEPTPSPERALLGRIRQATVRRLADAAAVPVFTLTAEADASAAARLRAELAGLADPAPTVTDLVVSAAGRALREHPAMNASAAEGAVLRHPRPHVGVAVDTEDGLVVPVVRDPGSPVAVAAEARELVGRARAGAATPADLDGATFTVSNLGMFGVAEFAAVIVPPQAGILAVGAVRELPRVRDGAVVAVPVMALTLTCDHRVVDGAQAARFLARLVALLERPLALMIEEGKS